MKPKSIKINYVYNLTYQLFLIIVPIIVTPYISRVLGENVSGQYSYSMSICTYFTLFSALGFTSYAQRLIAKHQDNVFQQSIDFCEVFIARLLPTGLTLLVYFVTVYRGIYGEKYNFIMIILAINVFAVAFDISFFFQGNEEFKKIVIRNVLIKVLSIVCIFAFVKTKNDLWIYTLIQSLSCFISNVSLWLYLPRMLKKVNKKELHPVRHLGPTLTLFLPTIATSVYTTLDKTLIGIITQDDAENGNYEYAEKLVKMTMTILTSLGTVMVPKNSKKFADGDKQGVIDNIYTTGRFVFLLGIPLALGTLTVSDNLIPWFLGDGYSKVANLMKLLSPIILIIGLSNVFGWQYLVPSGQDKKFTISILLGAICNFILNIILIQYLKSYGAAIATVIAEIVITSAMFQFIRKDIQFIVMLRNGWKYIIAGIVMFIPCYTESKLFSPSFIHTVMIAGTGVVVYAIMLLIMRDEFFLNSSSMILKKIK